MHVLWRWLGFHHKKQLSQHVVRAMQSKDVRLHCTFDGAGWGDQKKSLSQHIVRAMQSKDVRLHCTFDGAGWGVAVATAARSVVHPSAGEVRPPG